MGCVDGGDHEFGVEEVHVDGFRLRMVHTCTRCGAVAYEASRSDVVDIRGGFDTT